MIDRILDLVGVNDAAENLSDAVRGSREGAPECVNSLDGLRKLAALYHDGHSERVQKIQVMEAENEEREAAGREPIWGESLTCLEVEAELMLRFANELDEELAKIQLSGGDK